MKIHFRCPDCHEKLKAIHDLSGEEIECPVCGSAIEVPFVFVEPGVEIDGYLIEAKLGEGGMGSVFLARQLSMGRQIALKVLSPTMTSDPVMVKRFLREARSMALMTHPNIVQAIDAGEDEGQYYIAMEYVDGTTLESVIEDSGGPLDHEDSLCCILSLVQALEHAWEEKQIIHRDIKPDNIIFTTSGAPKLLDMGLAKSLTHNETANFNGSELLTMAGDVLGTPNYMSPEQVAGLPDLDFRTDIYGLGSTLYHMVTGVLPFGAGGSDSYEVLDARLEGTIHLTNPRLLNPELPAGAGKILRGMLGHTPEDRYESYARLRHDIERVLDGREPESGPQRSTTVINE